MFTIIGFFTKKIFGANIATIFISIMIGLIAAIAIPNYDKVLGVFGYQTRAVLKDSLAAAKSNLDAAVAINVDSKVAVDVLKKTVKNTEDTIVKNHTVEKKIDTKVQEIKETTKKKIDKVIETTSDKDLQEKEISSLQISSIWDAYCSFNSNEKCQVKTTT